MPLRGGVCLHNGDLRGREDVRQGCVYADQYYCIYLEGDNGLGRDPLRLQEGEVGTHEFLIWVSAFHVYYPAVNQPELREKEQ